MLTQLSCLQQHIVYVCLYHTVFNTVDIFSFVAIKVAPRITNPQYFSLAHIGTSHMEQSILLHGNLLPGSDLVLGVHSAGKTLSPIHGQSTHCPVSEIIPYMFSVYSFISVLRILVGLRWRPLQFPLSPVLCVIFFSTFLSSA